MEGLMSARKRLNLLLDKKLISILNWESLLGPQLNVTLTPKGW